MSVVDQVRTQARLFEAAKGYYNYQDENGLNPAHEYMRGRDFDDNAIRAAGIGYVTRDNALLEHQGYIGRMAIPYICADPTTTGSQRVVSVRFRCIQAHNCKEHGHSKYMGVAGDKLRLYNVRDFIKPSKIIVLCEGELDALTMSAMVGVPAVAVPGAKAWGPTKGYWTRLFQDYVQVLVAGDADKAGQEFVECVMDSPGMGAARPFMLPEGSDINGMFMRHGRDWFMERIYPQSGM